MIEETLFSNEEIAWLIKSNTVIADDADLEIQTSPPGNSALPQHNSDKSFTQKV